MTAYSSTTYIGQQIPGERNDCAVRTLMTTTGRPYAEAHTVIARATGRLPRRGTPSNALARLLDGGAPILGATFTRVHGAAGTLKYGKGPEGFMTRTRTVTIAQFVARNPRGTFYCLKASHAFAIVDGVVIDTWKPGPRCAIFAAWKVTSGASAPVVRPAPAPVVRPAPAPVVRPAPATGELLAALQGRGGKSSVRFAGGLEARVSAYARTHAGTYGAIDLVVYNAVKAEGKNPLDMSVRQYEVIAGWIKAAISAR